MPQASYCACRGTLVIWHLSGGGELADGLQLLVRMASSGNEQVMVMVRVRVRVRVRARVRVRVGGNEQVRWVGDRGWEAEPGP